MSIRLIGAYLMVNGQGNTANSGRRRRRMVKTCSAKCPLCQRLIADRDRDSLIARVKRHAKLSHQKDISAAQIEVEDLGLVARVFG